MAIAIINGRQVDLPDVASAEQIRHAGGIKAGRRIIRRTREGNYPVKPHESVHVHDEDVFIDAPSRVKGGDS